ncbi:helix-turn-helix transcriptional regulator [Natronoarchaeum sp. GCM10025703]|uniref:helix-turn-helix transcriptional regulator n=1 Tax=unclassified Natronoarchaeum TaxID=2620183 RepID=UPI0036162C29
MRVSAVLVVVILTCALLAAASGGAVAAPTDPSISGDDVPWSESVQTLQQAEDDGNESVRQTLRVQITGEGHAEWTVSTRYELEDEADREAFEQLVEDLQNGEEDIGYSTDTFRTYADGASAATDRQMILRDEQWNGSVEDGTGTLALSFTWTGFAAVDGDRVEVADVFQSGDGETWLPSLNDDQRLVIVAPDGYAVDGFSLDTPPDSGFEDRSAQWTGPETFEANDIRITYVTTSGPVEPPATGGLSTIALVGGGIGLLLLVALVAGVFLVNRSDEESIGSALSSTITNGETEAITAPDGQQPDGLPDEGAVGGATQHDEPAETETGGVAMASDADETDDGVDPDLLSDEERVMRLIERNGGRMKQANIVTETGWSNAKVSQLLSSMDEDGRIDKLRIGRENLISLPDEDITETEQ